MTRDQDDQESIAHSGAISLDQIRQLVPGVTACVDGGGTSRVKGRCCMPHMTFLHMTFLNMGAPQHVVIEDLFYRCQFPARKIERVDGVTGSGAMLFGLGSKVKRSHVITTVMRLGRTSVSAAEFS
ncbi:hypothetical protein [Ferrimonas pelagia]|uniref:Dirigent protein n=1 Tax=Ferrimonas pelagia TaxID=1177826 RepID=A0ABP9F578_9GAMM